MNMLRHIHIMQYVNCYSVTALQAALVLIPFLQERYSSFYDNELYFPKQWERQNITIDQLF